MTDNDREPRARPPHPEEPPVPEPPAEKPVPAEGEPTPESGDNEI
jgi:hypothetical protein